MTMLHDHTEKFHINPDQVVEDIESSDTYLSNIEAGYSRKLALGRAARTLSRVESADVDKRNQADLHAVVAEVEEYTHGLEGLRYGREQTKLSGKEFVAHKERSIKFNHAIKHMIDNDPSLDFDEIVSFVSMLHERSNADRWADDQTGWEQERLWFRSQMEATLRGMQHEIFARQIIESLGNGYKVSDDISIKDDLNGIDLKVSKDGQTTGVDVKASTITRDKARSKAKRAGRTPDSIIWSGIDSRKLDGRMRLTTEEVVEARRTMIAQLETLFSHQPQINRARAIGQMAAMMSRMPTPVAA